MGINLIITLRRGGGEKELEFEIEDPEVNHILSALYIPITRV